MTNITLIKIFPRPFNGCLDGDKYCTNNMIKDVHINCVTLKTHKIEPQMKTIIAIKEGQI